MPIIPWRSWDLESDWLDEWLEKPRWWRHWLEETPMVRTPKIDIYEDNGNLVAEVELPKVNPENIDVEVKDNVLRLEAKTEEKKEEKKKDYYRKEISSGYFKRVLSLPIEVVGEKAEAEYRDGILKITMPKAKPEKESKGIKIKIKK
ncbi:MAG: Hsp20/alpha crystallin family protein [Minisyncoccia bacterium]